MERDVKYGSTSIILAILAGLIVLIGLYVLAYNWSYDTMGGPDYRYGGKGARVFFWPINQVHRRVAPGYFDDDGADPYYRQFDTPVP
jgi:hypothetical protein